MKLFSLLTGLWCCSVVAWSQSLPYYFRYIDNTQGLSQNSVNCIWQDQHGYMWFGTNAGLNRFDGYEFKVFESRMGDSTSISNNVITCMLEDATGNLWVGTEIGLNYFDRKTETFKRYGYSFSHGEFTHDYIRSLAIDHTGVLWVGTGKGLMYFDAREGVFHAFTLDANKVPLSAWDIAALQAHPDGSLWIGFDTETVVDRLDLNRGVLEKYPMPPVVNDRRGISIYIDDAQTVWVGRRVNALNRLRRGEKTFSRVDFITPGLTGDIRGITSDAEGKIWVACVQAGVAILDPVQETCTVPKRDRFIPGSLGSYTLFSIYRDRSGGMWVGTHDEGVAFYHKNLRKFDLYQKVPTVAGSLSDKSVTDVYVDSRNRLWVATDYGLNVRIPGQDRFEHFFHRPGDAGSVPSNAVVSITEDHQGQLWMGSFQGGLSRYLENGRFITYRHDPRDSSSLSHNDVWNLLEDRQHRLWVGTLGGGLDMMDKDRQSFRHFRSSNNMLSNDVIQSLCEDRDGNIWVGTAYGLNRLGVHRVKRFYHDFKNQQSLSNNHIQCLYQDKIGRLWVGTMEGLNLYHPDTETFQAFYERDGLPGNAIASMLEDEHGNLWVSTSNGVARLQLNEEKGKLTIAVRRFDPDDGLQGREFRSGAGCKGPDGTMYFGGHNGLNAFRPDRVLEQAAPVPVVITRFKIFNRDINVNDSINNRVLLTEAIDRTPELVLKNHENFFSVEFAALEYLKPHATQYAYRLEGFHREWIYTSAERREATFTNLNPGEYYFRVKATNGDGVWGEDITTLKIVITPPFWKTKIGLTLLFVLLFALLFFLRWIIIQNAKRKLILEQERREILRQHELDMREIKFFTNISHEIRTPLTLIISPLEELLKRPLGKGDMDVVKMAYQNAQKLLNLAKQLLDLRKLEVQGLKYNPRVENIIGFIRDIVLSYRDYAEKKDISLLFRSNLNRYQTAFDPDKVEKIMFNLLSNAFKFTPTGGKITVELSLVEQTRIEAQQAPTQEMFFQIVVADTGRGIAPEYQQKVFERFFQVDEQKGNQTSGYGIGLSMVKEYVQLHGGRIELDSEVGKGSRFTITLPVERQQELALVTDDVSVVEDVVTHAPTTEAASASAGERPERMILLVEDNEDLRTYLRTRLEERYAIVEAGDGQEGLRMAREHLPNLILSDIMMPGMDGVAFCQAIRSDKTTSHIPIILLTAKTSDQQKIEGLAAGADEYITKPFNLEILSLRIQYLIDQRTRVFDRVQHQGTGAVEIAPQDIPVLPLDEKLIRKAIQAVEEHMADAEFSVEDLSREAGMSRAHFYKKLVALTGLTPLEFIRTIRLKRAAQLLRESQMSVAEIAFAVGFNNPRYFSRYFRDEFKMLPSKYAEAYGRSRNLHIEMDDFDDDKPV